MGGLETSQVVEGWCSSDDDYGDDNYSDNDNNNIHHNYNENDNYHNNHDDKDDENTTSIEQFTSRK